MKKARGDQKRKDKSDQDVDAYALSFGKGEIGPDFFPEAYGQFSSI